MKTSAELRSHVEILSAEGDRSEHLDASAMKSAQEYCCSKLTAAGWNVERQQLSYSNKFGIRDDVGPWHPWPARIYKELTGANLIATQPGAQGPFLVISGHLDSVKGSPGADDNASAVAVILELAAALQQDSPLPVLLALFDMEEVGHFGAKELARCMHADGSAAAIINMDMIGFFIDAPRTQKFPLGRITAPGAARSIRKRERRSDFLFSIRRKNAADLAAAITRHSTTAGLPIIEVHDPRPTSAIKPLVNAVWPPFAHYDRSDHAEFSALGIPAIALTDGAMIRNPNYHKATDTADTLDYERMAMLVEGLAGTCREFAARTTTMPTQLWARGLQEPG